MTLIHKPVLLPQAVDALHINADGVYLDGTLGGAGHAAAIYSLLSSAGKMVGIDKDPQAIDRATAAFTGRDNVILHNASYAEVKQVLYNSGIWHIDGVLLDLGVSSFQLDDEARGFSYSQDSRLDMRMDNSCGPDAAEILNTYSRQQLARIFNEYGEEPFGLKLADIIVKDRVRRPITQASELVALVQRGLGKGLRGMTAIRRIFQALRIEVNNELEDLDVFLHSIVELLNPGARIVIITFHSLEDRRVKKFFKQQANPCTCPADFPRCVCGAQPQLKLINRKALVPDPEEIRENPRAKSAKLRVAERI